MFMKVESWQKPIDVLEMLPEPANCEMTNNQLGFLCGMLRKKRPRKILEIGVAAGGTTCVVMEALECICKENDAEVVLHSVDLNKQYYKDVSKVTGYMSDYMNGRCPHVHHCVYYGAMLPKYIEQIGGDIDFLILDTSHVLPGEILDFLLTLPYLHERATVIIHDIMLSLLVNERPVSISTNVLLESVYADKCLLYADNCPGGVDNIGAFVLTPDTMKNIANVFFALLKRWSYMLTGEQVEGYRSYFARIYDNECMCLFEAAIQLNYLVKQNEYRDRIAECYGDAQEMEYVLRLWKTAAGKIVIYGIGFFGEAMLSYARVASLKIDAFAITDGQPLRSLQGCDLPIYELSKIPYKPEECIIIIAVHDKNTRKLIEKELRYRGYFRIL